MTGEVTSYGGSGVVEHGAAGVTYIKAGLTTKTVCITQTRPCNIQQYFTPAKNVNF